MLKRWGPMLFCCVCVIALAALMFLPLRTTVIRLAMIASALGVWLGLLALIWPTRSARFAALALTAVLGIILLLPGHTHLNEEQLRATYIAHLQRYDQVRYVYGGENARGIDCSGLVRAAMMEALAIDGFREMNPRALRSAAFLWWQDSNAIDLGKGVGGMILPIDSDDYRKLSQHSNLLPGDLAVTESGSHVIAFLGGERWIEAEPNVGGTHIFDLKGRFADIADEGVRFVRWKWFSR